MKYRAWDTKFNSWINPKDVQVNGLGQVFIFQDENLEWYEDRIGQAKILKDTQLKDKNGKEIYEGDILAINNISNIKYEVRFGNYEPYGSNERQQGFYLYDDSDNSTIPLTENYKIVGNIYENPELLGGGK